MSSGSFDSEIELEPRMRMREPGAASRRRTVCTTTPGARELSASEKVLIAALLNVRAVDRWSRRAVLAPALGLSGRRDDDLIERRRRRRAIVKSAVVPSAVTVTARDCGA